MPALLPGKRCVQVPAYATFLADQQQQAQQMQQRQQGQQEGTQACKEAGSASPAPGRISAGPAAAVPSWQGVPFATKQSYFHAFPLPTRCLPSSGGTASAAGGQAAGLGSADFVHASSGSSGAPTLWARNVFDELAVCTR